MEIIILTGMSGAGKSQAVDALEDIGFYCVDNVPPRLLAKFTEITAESNGQISRIALVVDVRSHGMFSDFLSCVQNLQSSDISFRLLFLDCSDEVLNRRYKETRRRHPLLGETVTSTGQAIGEERIMLESARQIADRVIDTTLLSSSQLKQQIKDQFQSAGDHYMGITCISFGFKYGTPRDADLMFDVRCLPNPFYVEQLRPLTGLDKTVRDYVMGFEEAKGLEQRLRELMDYSIPLYLQEGKTQLVVAFGCTGGKHRSITFAERMARYLAEKGFSVNMIHRDISR